MATGARYSLTPTALVVVATGVVSWIVAFTEDSLLAHLLAALAFAFAAVAFLLAARSVRGVNVTRVVDATAFDGDDVKVQFVVTNTNKGARSLLEISNLLYTSRGPAGRVSALVSELPAGASATATGAVPDVRRGEFVFAPPVVSSSDPFGLFGCSREMDESVAPSSRVTVFPKPFAIDSLAIASDLSWSISGLEPTSSAGAGGEFLGTREYRFGDSVRAIHWPLSARMGELIVKEFERNTSTEVSIFLDLDAHADWGRGRASTFEYAVRIAASVGSYAAARGNAVQLVAYGSKWVVVPPGKGAYHQQMLMHYLSSFEPVGVAPFNYVIGQMAPRLKEGASAVLIFPNEHLQLELFGPALEGLWARRIRVTAILMNVESFLDDGFARPPGDNEVETYLASRGASVYVVRKDQDLSQALAVPMAGPAR